MSPWHVHVSPKSRSGVDRRRQEHIELARRRLRTWDWSHEAGAACSGEGLGASTVVDGSSSSGAGLGREVFEMVSPMQAHPEAKSARPCRRRHEHIAAARRRLCTEPAEQPPIGQGSGQSLWPRSWRCAWNSSKLDDPVRSGYHSGLEVMPLFIAHVTWSWHGSPGKAVWQLLSPRASDPLETSKTFPCKST